MKRLLLNTKTSDFMGLLEKAQQRKPIINKSEDEKDINILKKENSDINKKPLGLLQKAKQKRQKIVTKNIMNNGERDYIRIEISDNGTGIPNNLIEKVFDPYFRSEQRASSRNAAGLGLFIARQNMEDHGGNIDVISKIEKGTTFTLTLPAKN